MLSIKPYFFSILGKKIVKMREEGIDVIRIDMGSPDLPPSRDIIDGLVEIAEREDMHGYTLGSGTQSFRKAVSNHYQKRFNVSLDPGAEVIDLIGSKEGLFIINQVLLNPGDLVLVPDPGYGVYSSGARIAGAKVHRMPLMDKNNFLPVLDSIPIDIAQNAKLMWLNYPNNPTGAIASKEFFEEVINFGKQYEIVIAHDAAYSEVSYDGYRPPSILEVKDAKDVALEFNSFSKAFNMAGWRLGIAVGRSDVLELIESYKSLQDSAIFAAILSAGEMALQLDQSWIDNRNEIYKQRRDLMVEGLSSAGFEVSTPKAAFYLWVKIPNNTKSEEYCENMLNEIGVSTTPGSVFGEHGEGYFRISLVTKQERLSEAVTKIQSWL